MSDWIWGGASISSVSTVTAGREIEVRDGSSCGWGRKITELSSGYRMPQESATPWECRKLFL